MAEKVVFRFHALQRMFERGISDTDVLAVIKSGKTIENYPEDKPYPSSLKLGFSGKRPIHAVIAMDTAENILIVVTVYEPDPKQWDKKFERRKKK